jgi:peptidase M1-like protein
MIPTLFSILSLLQAAGPRAPYWQQGVRYDITATLDEPRGVLAGAERIVYFNRSPDTLTSFSLHLYLNAFRPGSRWAEADSMERRRRFNDLKDPDYAFNHVYNVRIMGRPATPIYPLASDSTIVRFALPAPLAPGDSMTVDLDWDARPSTTPRRQGRQGRRFDFAQWYPKVVVYDRYGWEEHAVYPGGEFYGEFGTFLVQLDLPEDEVMGATGVPLCGDPGWERANRVPDKPIAYRRDYYPSAPTFRAEGRDCVRGDGAGDRRSGGQAVPLEGWAGGPADGRKRLVWYAEDVHHFAMSLNPDYRYEGGSWGRVGIHVLYQPGDEASWGQGVAVQRTAVALEWLDGFFGPFAWPQITNVHRIEGGGTEFPMMIHDGSASQGLIVHELGHNYVMGILANNEWREGWLDEGFTSYQETRFGEAHGESWFAGTEEWLTGLDLDGMSEPASLVSEQYRDFTSYGISIYNRGEWFFHQLEHAVGPAVMHRIMRTYYDRWKLKHVDEAAFREVAEEVSGQELGVLFAQGLHGTELVDYAVGRVKKRPSAAGRLGGSAEEGWVTRVEVVRKAPGQRPVDVLVVARGDTGYARTDGLATREWVEVTTRSEPRSVVLDPFIMTGDWNQLNNEKRFGFHLMGSSRPPKLHLDTWFSTPVHRDRIAWAFMPVAWYNDAGGITIGFRHRRNYWGRFAQTTSMSTWSTGWESDRDIKDKDFWFRIRNPIWLQAPGVSQSLDVYNMEGRYGARVTAEKVRRDHLAFGPTRRMAASLQWLEPDDFRYLGGVASPYYEPAGTVELTLEAGVGDRRGRWDLAARAAAGGGLVYSRGGLAAARPAGTLSPLYGRGRLELTARRALDQKQRWSLGARGYVEGVVSDGPGVRQRLAYAAGAGPLEQFSNPFLRSDGALLRRPDVNYQMAGGGNARGFSPALASRGLVAGNVELERALRARPRSRLLTRVALAAFGDAAQALQGDFLPSTAAVFPAGLVQRFLADAGVGLRTGHRIGQTSFTLRFDLPLWVNHPALAQDTHPGSNQFGFRWLVGVGAAW